MYLYTRLENMRIACLIKKLIYKFIEPCLDASINRKMIARNE